MHPILSHRSRILGYLAGWLPLALLIAALLSIVGQLSWLMAAALGIPLGLVYAFVCLAAWYPCRSVPLHRTQLWRAAASHSLAATLSSGIWQLFGAVWAFVLSRLPVAALANTSEDFSRSVPLLFFVGLLIYTLAAAASYLVIAFESSRAAELRAHDANKQQELVAQELALARQLQQRLLPAGRYQEHGVEISARTVPARYVGGDFYDYFRLADGSFRIAVGDVSGKGTAASLVMATVKAMLPLLATEHSLEETMRILNSKLFRELDAREFVALALASFDPTTGRFELVNAGLPDPYLISERDPPSPIEAPFPRLPLGMKDNLDYRSIGLDINLENAASERIFFCSDGIPEAHDIDGNLLGYDRMEKMLANWSPDLQTWTEELFDRLDEVFAPEISDDWTILVFTPHLRHQNQRTVE